ncbi:type II secretion system F family protein [Jatrophihabitans telluris]|uniref:Type II secretion system F family protein n=1 Tax=Jatrophihabitans telluris TaxID=2038343 RepID=A0ABY4R161_9ACTN|nr:type II secretion system F family protein [Jatrophihabitans telluris]UQX89504.1 type II secretion system F family protein [Jatrophihabitans telluris]
MGALLGLVAGLGLLLMWRSGARAPKQSTRRRRWSAGREELLRQAGVTGVSSAQLSVLQTGCGVFAFVAVEVMTGAVPVAVCFAAFAAAAPMAMVLRMRGRRQFALRELWPEAIDNLASAVRAGMSLPEGISALAVRGPEPLRPAFTRFAIEYRASGRFSTCLDSLKHELSDPVGDRVCETLRVARDVGGSDLGTVLRTLSELLRADGRTRAELETRQSWTVNAARLAVAAPWLVLLLLGTQPATLRAYNSGGGVVLLAAGAGICLLAYRVMVRIGRLPEEARVLR